MEFKTRINYISDAWMRIKNHCRTTVNKQFSEVEPTKEFKKKLVISEHTPLRLLEVDWTWLKIPYWCSTEWSRHKFEKFISTQRDDRTNCDVPRSEKPQGAEVIYDGYANAQNLIDAERKRLCYQATDEARRYGESLKREINKFEPEVAFGLQKNCIYRCGCPEFDSCGYWEKFCKRHKDENLMDIETRYRLADEEFYRNNKEEQN